MSIFFIQSSNGTLSANCSDDNLSCDQKELCKPLLEYYNNLYVCFLFTSSFAPLILETVGKHFGQVVLKLTMTLLTTAGLICLFFYEKDPIYLFISWNCLGFPSTMYIITNINQLCALSPKNKALLVSILNGKNNLKTKLYL